MHCGNLRAIKWTFISEAKISTYVDIFGLFDQVERILDIYFTQFPLRKASILEILEKTSREHADGVRLGFHSAESGLGQENQREHFVCWDAGAVTETSKLIRR